MARGGSGGRGDGMTHRDLNDPDGPGSPADQDDLVSSGFPHGPQTNPVVRRGGRSDGMVARGLSDADGFEADDDGAAGSWSAVGQGGNTTDRSRPEVSGQLLRGYVWQETAAGINAPSITEPDVNPGGAIKPV